MSDAADVPVVVCVDDEPAVLSSLQRLLRNEPYRLLTTGSPEEAVTWILEKKAALVIADQRMPGMTGLELLELVRACSPSTVRVMLSGQSDLSGVLQVAQLEAIDRRFRKPWDCDELKAALRSLISAARRPAAAGPPGP